MVDAKKINKALEAENEELRYLLSEASDTIEAIRTGQVDALVLQKDDAHELYTLQSADQAYRIFIEKMTEGAVTLSREGFILYCNSSFADMIGRALSEVIGIYFRDCVTPAEEKHYDALFIKCAVQDCKGEVILNGKKKEIPVQLSFAAIKRDGDHVYSLIVTDLSTQKNAQSQLEKNNAALATSNRDLQRFASVASHDLQEPVRKIQVFSGLLKKTGDTLSDENKKYLEKIISSAERMKALIVDMLDYARLSSDEGNFLLTDLNEVLKEVAEDLELSISDTGAVITSEKLPVLFANRSQMRQVFQNIISNAIKFSGKQNHPEILITAKRIKEKKFGSAEKVKGDYFLISFKDKGIGFDEQYAGNIFELFERLNTKDAYEGTGIGLAIAKKIIEKHKGMIAAKSKENEGADFLIILPATELLSAGN